MFDELERLRENENLRRLLAHYTDAGADNTEVWQDRLMELAGVEPRRLAKLHGELLAFSWIEQNTGRVSIPRPGSVPQCYRATPAGRRALKRAAVAAEDQEDAEVI